MLGLIPYCVIVILAIIFRVNELDDTGKCFIGLKRESSFLLLIYDLVINVRPVTSRDEANVGVPDNSISNSHFGIVFI